jgi:undecaprenyl-phosphate galactose phosphotransferase/putative colanic acid biosynthesis UDP-glucose lipid carrier transferase
MPLRKTNLYRYSPYAKFIGLFGDLFLLNSAILVSYYLRYGNIVRLTDSFAQPTLILSNLIWVFICLYFDAYNVMRVGYIETLFSKTTKLLGLYLCILFALIVFLNYDGVSRLRLMYFSAVFFSELLLFRYVFVWILKKIRKAGYNYRRVIIIGAGQKGKDIQKILSKDVSYGYQVLGFFDDVASTKESASAGSVGGLNEAIDFLKTNGVHEVYIASSNYASKEISKIILFCERNLIRLKFVPDFQNFTKSKRVEINFYDDLPVISFRQEPLESTLNRTVKRLFDIAFATAIIVCIFPWLFPIIMLAVKLSSRGSVFFKQERTGEQNKVFWCYKFRTMHVNDLAHEQQATRHDARITNVGRFLRQTNLDELPQFFNVLFGSMSVVGPRPHMLKHTEEYSALINSFIVRQLIKPGITGWAQVNGFRGETHTLVQMEKRVEYDIWYIENWSFYLDIKILFRTIANMVRGDKNAF